MIPHEPRNRPADRPTSLPVRASAGLATTLAVLLAVGLAMPAPGAESAAPAAGEAPAVEVVALPSAGSPLVAVRLLFDVGSIHDPEGREGLAALTGRMVAEAGTEERTYAELVDALYPLAASISVHTDREVTAIYGTVHRDTLERYTELLLEAVLHPAFAAADLERHKSELEAYLTSNLRSANDELLGLEAIQQQIFDGHPYHHAPQGTVQGLAAVTLDDVKGFYRRHYNRANLVLGVAGGYPEGFAEKLAGQLAALPAGTKKDAGHRPLPKPQEVEGRRFTLVEKGTASVGIHFGYPLLLNRSDPDYYPLMVANSFLGEHRTSHGRLMQQLREKRGLNYGDYSYIEHWHAPPFTNTPSPNFPRRQQYFSVWVRPVRPETAHFALRAALHEVQRLRERGMTEAEFELTRDYLVNYSKLWAQTLSSRLGFHLDSRFYGMDYYIHQIEERLGELELADVNRAIEKYLTTSDYEAVMVTDDAAAVKAYLEAGEPSPMTYNSEVPEAVLEADESIEALAVEPTAIEIVPVEELFEGKAQPASRK